MESERRRYPIRTTRSATKQVEEGQCEKRIMRSSSRMKSSLKKTVKVPIKDDHQTTKQCSPPKRHKIGAGNMPEISKEFEISLSRTPKRSLFNEINDENVLSPKKDKPDENLSPFLGEKNLEDNRAKKSSLAPVNLFKEKIVSVYQEVRRALSVSTETQLKCREEYIEFITSFLEKHVNSRKPGSLYISGGPGTGKTACLTRILQAVKFESAQEIKPIVVNCASLKSPNCVYERIWAELVGAKNVKKGGSDYEKLVRDKQMNCCQPLVLILDEVDYLESKDQRILYSIFEWPAMKNSKLVLIGIANALDLTDRVLPRLQTDPKFRPQLLHFKPYDVNQIVTIVQERLKHLSTDAQQLIRPAALRYCACKVASVTGDIRRAIDVCRRAVELAEVEAQRRHILQPRAEVASLSNSNSPLKKSPKKSIKYIEIPLMATIINEVYGNRLNDGDSGDGLPIQQKFLLCTLLLVLKKGKSKDVTLGKFHDIYSRVCKKHQVTAVHQSEFSNLCTLVEDRGLIFIKKNKDIRLSKVNLKVDESDVEFALHDKSLLACILADTSFFG